LTDPRAEYQNRLASRLRTLTSKERLHVRAGNLKLATIVAALVLLWLCLSKSLFAPVWLSVPVAIYVVLVVWHELVLRARTRAEGAVAFYRQGIARMEDRWAGTGQSGERFRDANHVYADDLDLFGKGCLFQLLSTARLPMGENCLAQWLRFPSPAGEIIERQKLVADLRDRLDLREFIAVTGEALRARLNPESLTEWAEGAAGMPAAAWRGVAIVLSLAAAAALVYGLTTFQYRPFLLVLISEAFVWGWLQRRALKVIGALNCNAEGLGLFSNILDSIEKESFASVRLQGYVAELRSGREPACRAIRRLARTVYWIDSCEGLFAKLLNVPALYTVQVGFAAESWRRNSGRKIRRWIEIVAEMEALLSLASYSYEHPSDPFPEFDEASGAPAFFDGQEMGHPLIAAAKCVRNSVRLDHQTRLLLVSGSNMSGKSTLLRTVGINAVLANAGAPVRAKSLRMSPLALGTRIRTTDSLQEGRSNFYTEILRIRKVFELADDPKPLLYLFDELLEGTNSKDRRIGAEGLLQALIAKKAIGIVSTHDLALTEVTGLLGAAVRNQHFQDSVVNGEMSFDYKLHEGVVAKSNALELMRLIGLKV
jgi:MutS domain V